MNPIYLTLLSLSIGFTLGYSAHRVYSSQNRGELLVRKAIKKHFHSPNYHLLNHITLKHGKSTTQIDHILVSSYGVFVIETKNYKGWIFANPKHETWTQVLFKAKFKFQNPIYQNHRHVVAVRELLDFLPQEAIKSVVVFSGDAEFKTDMPSNVFTLPMLIDYLNSCTEELLSLNRVQFSVGRIETARLEISEMTDVEHVKALQKRYGHK
ncbi:nuclease-related domain-containing protein [Limnohabitans sp. Rim11]|uniref:nuclease-related domain-containing protein n=1 Tax=Limnohabitans sp. Rim11 TaxID=1100719 RepID=UPI000A4F3412|nr:nuclease-related domain-containing protein [Limnohabitans sp. Rim11]